MTSVRSCRKGHFPSSIGNPRHQPADSAWQNDSGGNIGLESISYTVQSSTHDLRGSATMQQQEGGENVAVIVRVTRFSVEFWRKIFRLMSIGLEPILVSVSSLRSMWRSGVVAVSH